MKSTNDNLIWSKIGKFEQKFVAMLFVLMVVCSQSLFAHSNFSTEIDSIAADHSDQQSTIPNVIANNTVIYVASGAQIISSEDKINTVEISSSSSDKTNIRPTKIKKKLSKTLLTSKKKSKSYKSASNPTKYTSPFSHSESIRSHDGSVIIVVRPHSPLLYHPEQIHVHFLQPKFLKEIFISYQSSIFSFSTYFSFWVRPPPMLV